MIFEFILWYFTTLKRFDPFSRCALHRLRRELLCLEAKTECGEDLEVSRLCAIFRGENSETEHEDYDEPCLSFGQHMSGSFGFARNAGVILLNRGERHVEMITITRL